MSKLGCMGHREGRGQSVIMCKHIFYSLPFPVGKGGLQCLESFYAPSYVVSILSYSLTLLSVSLSRFGCILSCLYLNDNLIYACWYGGLVYGSGVWERRQSWTMNYVYVVWLCVSLLLKELSCVVRGLSENSLKDTEFIWESQDCDRAHIIKDGLL
jgi:hypothetical protein